MTIHMNIGEEPCDPQSIASSAHKIDIRDLDEIAKHAAHNSVSIDLKSRDLKEEIRGRDESAGRICIVGTLPKERRGLGRAPMIVGALLVIFALNGAQMLFLGKTQGSEALATAAQAFTSLKEGGGGFLNNDSALSEDIFERAQVLFREAEAKGDFLLKHNSPWIPEPMRVKSLRNLIDAGEKMAIVGKHLTNLQNAFSEKPETGSLTEYIREVSTRDLEPALLELSAILELLREVDLSGTEYEETFKQYLSELEGLLSLVSMWDKAKEPLLTALGDKHPQTYLLIPGNNDEMRTGGPFFGSLAIVEINDGHISKFDFKDVYEFDNVNTDWTEIPVRELKDMVGNWGLRDSLVSPDFPVSAEYARKFLDKYPDAPGVDGVIMLSLSSAETLAQILGPLSVEALGKALEPEDFSIVLSTLIEAKAFGAAAPKEILQNTMQTFMEEAKKPENLAPLALALLGETQKKNVLFYHSNPIVQEVLDSFNLTGDLKNLNEMTGDYFMPLFTNLGGNKADRYLKTQVFHDTELTESGELISSIKLGRHYDFDENRLSGMKATLAEYGFTDWTEGLESVMGNGLSRTGIRLYIPEGAELIEVGGNYLRDDLQFYYDPLLDHSYYYLDQILAPGHSRFIEISYIVPAKIDKNFSEYSFDFLKQPGLRNVFYEKTFTAEHHEVLSAHPVAIDTREGTDYLVNDILDNDLELLILLHR